MRRPLPLLLTILLAGCSVPALKPVLKPITRLQAAPAAFLVRGAADRPAISIIMDDLGDRRSAGARTLALPGPVACAFLPGSPHARRQARDARALGREVLLHLPLEPVSGAHVIPAALTRQSTASDLRRALAHGLREVPDAHGLNNHQGSLLTQSTRHMDWLMRELRGRGGLYFVDSRTSARSVAFTRARAAGVPAARRDVFLDDVPEPAAIRHQWALLLRLATRRGTALAIAHPHPATFRILEEEIPRLRSRGIRLVPPSELIRLQQNDVLTRPRLEFSAGLKLTG